MGRKGTGRPVNLYHGQKSNECVVNLCVFNVRHSLLGIYELSSGSDLSLLLWNHTGPSFLVETLPHRIFSLELSRQKEGDTGLP